MKGLQQKYAKNPKDKLFCFPCAKFALQIENQSTVSAKIFSYISGSG